MTLHQMKRIHQWHQSHRDEHPLEYLLWDSVLTLWLMGWIGWLPAFALDDAVWAAPLCVTGMFLPHTYTRWRARAHRQQRVRCDWLDLS